MRTILAVLLSSSLAFAEPPSDAPLADRSVHLDAGEQAPFSGRLLSDVEHIESERICADDHQFRKEATSGGKLLISPIAIVAIVVGCLALGAAVATGVTLAVKR
jgi:hypothetical protein